MFLVEITVDKTRKDVDFITRVLRKLEIACYNAKAMIKVLGILQNEAHRNLLIEAVKDDIKKG